MLGIEPKSAQLALVGVGVDATLHRQNFRVVGVEGALVENRLDLCRLKDPQRLVARLTNIEAVKAKIFQGFLEVPILDLFPVFFHTNSFVKRGKRRLPRVSHPPKYRADYGLLEVRRVHGTR